GSTAVGKRIAKEIAGTRKHATLELGGKAANIVFDDAPVDQAIEGIVNGIFFNQGQVCCAGSRASPSSPTPARPRARRAGARTASSRRRGTGSPRRSSRA